MLGVAEWFAHMNTVANEPLLITPGTEYSRVPARAAVGMATARAARAHLSCLPVTKVSHRITVECMKRSPFGGILVDNVERCPLVTRARRVACGSTEFCDRLDIKA